MLKFQGKGGKPMDVLIGLIGFCAAALLIYYVYILMKGESQK
jgi:hypothetical protein